MEIHKTYYFDTKHQRVCSAAYLRELLYSIYTMLQPSTSPYVPHPTPNFSIRPNISQRDCVAYQLLLTWQEFHEKLLQSMNDENISSWTFEELSIWVLIARLLHGCLMEFASKNGWGVYFKCKENPENLLRLYRSCENSFKMDPYYANSIHMSYNELFGDCKACDLEQVKGVVPIIEGKVLLNSQHDFNRLFGIDETFVFNNSGTKLSQENQDVERAKKLIGAIQTVYVKPLKAFIQQTQNR